MARMSFPAERKAAQSRKVVVRLRHSDKTDTLLEREARLVEGLVHHLLVIGKQIVSVDGKAPPKGSDGDCYFDGEGCGPYWKSEL